MIFVVISSWNYISTDWVIVYNEIRYLIETKSCFYMCVYHEQIYAFESCHGHVHVLAINAGVLSLSCSGTLLTSKSKDTHRQWCSFGPLISILGPIWPARENNCVDCFMQGGHFCLAHCHDFRMHKNTWGSGVNFYLRHLSLNCLGSLWPTRKKWLRTPAFVRSPVA